jgi:uncharacterized NAD-dependent epimerase/dehydratase family protein
MTSMRHVMNLHIDLMNVFRESKFIGINLLTFAFEEEKALDVINKSQEEFGIETTDLIRFGNRGLIDAIEEVL